MKRNIVIILLIAAGGAGAWWYAVQMKRVEEPVSLHVPEVLRSTGAKYAATDSLAACRLPNGDVRLFATMKKGDRLEVFDAATGRHVRSLGKTGGAIGEFRYPNGLAIVHFRSGSDPQSSRSSRPVLAVVERDNARVQCFFADDLSPAGVFGHGDLTKPYGIAVSCVEDAPVAIITDGNGKGGHFAFAYRLRLTDGRVEPGLARSFGDSDGTGAINEPESIVVDDEHERILFCDEDDLNVKVYTIDGKFTGTTFADEIIFGEPEGIALMSGGPSTGDSSKGTSGPSGGWVILTDQREDLTVWHVFDREDYRRIGTFTGAPAIANTDGICILAEPFGPFRAGALFAVHDDQEIRGYDLADVTNQMGG